MPKAPKYFIFCFGCPQAAERQMNGIQKAEFPEFHACFGCPKGSGGSGNPLEMNKGTRTNYSTSIGQIAHLANKGLRHLLKCCPLFSVLQGHVGMDRSLEALVNIVGVYWIGFPIRLHGHAVVETTTVVDICGGNHQKPGGGAKWSSSNHPQMCPTCPSQSSRSWLLTTHLDWLILAVLFLYVSVEIMIIWEIVYIYIYICHAETGVAPQATNIPSHCLIDCSSPNKS